MLQFWRKITIGICCFAASCHVALASSAIEGIRVYQKNSHTTSERNQMLANDIHRYQNADNLWEALRDDFNLPHYENNPLVQQKIDWYMNHQDFLYRSMSRAAPYLYYILQQVKKRRLPTEVMLLPIFESSYNPFAYSDRGAAGIWQMMPATASDEGLRQNWWYDGRRDVIASTKGALNHLAYLQSFFDGNWLLAIAAYNTGEGNVLAAIRRNINAGESTDYWSLPVAQQTRDYVPQLLALAIIISHPEKYPIELPPVRNAPYLAQVDVGTQIDLNHAANLAGLSLKKLMQLNPGFNRSTTDPNGPYKLILPIENVQVFTENFARSPFSTRTHYAHYKVKSGDTIKTIAKRFNTSPSLIRQMNPTVASLHPGKSLVVPHQKASLEQTIVAAERPIVRSVSTKKIKPEPTTDTAVLNTALQNMNSQYTMQPGDTLYMVRMGDDLEKVAKHFRINKNILVAVNRLQNQGLHVGQHLVIPTHPKQETAQQYQISPGDTIYMVRAGDTVDGIARKFHTTPQAVRLANLLSDNQLQEGDRLVIPTHA